MTRSQAPILVTGGAGFVGASLCARLVRAGERVVSLDNLNSGSEGNWASDVRDEIESLHADVRDAEALAEVIGRSRPKTVYHLAAIHFIPACDADPAGAISVNVVGSQTLLTACAAHGDSSSLVLASTGAVYGPSSTPHTEDDPLEPTDIYGLTKLWMEQAAQLHHKRTGAAIGVARLFNVIGAGETNAHLVPEIISQAERSDQLALGNLTTRRDYVAVDDVIEGLVALAENTSPSEVLTCNIGAERPIDGYQLVTTLGEVMGRKLNIRVDEGRMRASDRPLLESDCTRAHERLGWSARTPLQDALQAAVNDSERYRLQSCVKAQI